MSSLSAFVRAVSVLSALGAATSRAAYVPIYGGPTYDSTTQTGYQGANLPVAPGATAADGVGVAAAGKFSGGVNLGTRAIRLGVGGAKVLDDLGTNAIGTSGSTAYAVNSIGAAVGYSFSYVGGNFVGRRAVRWDPSTTAAVELGNIGTDASGVSSSTAYAVSPVGTAVGYADRYAGGSFVGQRAVRWDAGGTAATELGNLGTDAGGTSNGAAFSVNAVGTAVGYATGYAGGISTGARPVRWDASGTAATELGNLGTDGSTGNTNGRAYAVNDAGTTVGFVEKFVAGVSVGDRAVRWGANETVATELGNLDADGNGGTDSYAYAVNASGSAVGSAVKYANGVNLGTRAVRWDANEIAATELGNLGLSNTGATTSRANAVNASGAAVGSVLRYAGGATAGLRAVYWGTDGVAIDLNTLIDPAAGWTLTDARGLSNANWITGVGRFDPDGAGPLTAYDRAFLIQIPEPTSFGLVACGALPLLWMRRRGYGAVARRRILTPHL